MEGWGGGGGGGCGRPGNREVLTAMVTSHEKTGHRKGRRILFTTFRINLLHGRKSVYLGEVKKTNMFSVPVRFLF